MPEGNKTEKATPKKRRDERKKGNVFLSKDAVSVATLIVGYFILRFTLGGIIGRLSNFFNVCFQMMRDLPAGALQGQMPAIVREGAFTLALTMAPMMLAVAGTAIISTFLQTKLLVAGDSLKPKFSRINPLEGFKRLFSLRSVVEAMKGLLKIGLLLFIVYHFISGCLTDFMNYLDSDVGAACANLLSRLSTMVLQVIVAFIAVAAFDFYYQWWDYERQMKMTKQEVKEEYKQTEGDPKVKSKIREMQRTRAMSRMMQKVPEADVIIRNPTHVAVALRYKPERDNAPVVLAKGLDELALRIVRVGGEAGVSVIENVPLARAIYASAELDREIPPELYSAVADVLVYLYQINGNDKQPGL